MGMDRKSFGIRIRSEVTLDWVEFTDVNAGISSGAWLYLDQCDLQ